MGSSGWHWRDGVLSLQTGEDSTALIVSKSADSDLIDITTGQPAAVLDTPVATSTHGQAVLRKAAHTAIWPGEAMAQYWLVWPLADGSYAHLSLPYANGAKSTWGWRADQAADTAVALARHLEARRMPTGFAVVDQTDGFNSGYGGQPTITLCRVGTGDVAAAAADPQHHGCLQVTAFGARANPYAQPPAGFAAVDVGGIPVGVDVATGRAARAVSGGAVAVYADPRLDLSLADLAGIIASVSADQDYLGQLNLAHQPPAANARQVAVTPDAVPQQFPVTVTDVPADLKPSMWTVAGGQFTLTYASDRPDHRQMTVASRPPPMHFRLAPELMPANPNPATAPASGPKTSDPATAPASSGAPSGVPSTWAQPPPTGIDPGFIRTTWPTMSTTLPDGRTVWVSLSDGTRAELAAVVAGIGVEPMTLPGGLTLTDGIEGFPGRSLVGGPSADKQSVALCPPGTPEGSDFAYELDPSSQRCPIVVTGVSKYPPDYLRFSTLRPGWVVGVPRTDGSTLMVVVDATRTVAAAYLPGGRWVTMGLPHDGALSDVTGYLSLLGTAQLPG